MITQAFVLGAGLGKRLRPLTDDLPKPLIPIYQKPLITFALDHLCGLGIESFVINTHHLAAKFDSLGGSYAGRPLRLVHEPVLLGTGGGLKNVEGVLRDEPFIVYSGDILTDFDLAPLVEDIFATGNDVTLALQKDRARRRDRFAGRPRGGHRKPVWPGRRVRPRRRVRLEPANFPKDSAGPEPLVYSDRHGMDRAGRQNRRRCSGRRQVVQHRLSR